MIVIGLNPSTADEAKDDPTIRRCIAFAKREDCGRLVMLNLFAFRARKPADMLTARDPVGPGTDRALRDYAGGPRTSIVVAAWGRRGPRKRVAEVMSLFAIIHCFGRNKDRSPKHPLYLRADTPLRRYRDVGRNEKRRGFAALKSRMR